MKKRLLSTAILASALLVPAFASAAPVLYDIRFTGADIWTYSADAAGEAPFDQSAPRRYRDFDTCTDPGCIAATTYGVSGSTGSTAANLGFNPLFGVAGAQNGFAFDEINLWGSGNPPTAAVGTGAWNETYTSVGSGGSAPGASSWNVIQAPTGWTFGIVDANQTGGIGDGAHAFPVWRSGTGATLSQANMNLADFVFEVQVLIDSINGITADASGCTPFCNVRVYFGGASDDLQMTGPGNHEVSGIMTLQISVVPEPASLALLGLGLAGLGFSRRKKA